MVVRDIQMKGVKCTTQCAACLLGECDMDAVDTPDQDGTGQQHRPEKPGGAAACHVRRRLI